MVYIKCPVLDVRNGADKIEEQINSIISKEKGVFKDIKQSFAPNGKLFITLIFEESKKILKE